MKYTVHIISHVEAEGRMEALYNRLPGVEVEAYSADAAAERVVDAISRLIREQDDGRPDSRRSWPGAEP